MNENLNEQTATAETEQPTFDGTQQPPTFDGTQQPPTFDGTQQPPTFDGTQQPPTFDGTQQPPTFDGTQQPPTFDETQQPPTFDGTQQPPTFDGMQQPPTFDGTQQPPMFGQNFMPPPPPNGNMWGNAGFAGEEMLNGNNFAPENFGAPSDLSGIIDNSASISVNIGEQNNFSNFAQGGMMPPPMFGGQGGQFNQMPQQAAQTQAE